MMNKSVAITVILFIQFTLTGQGFTHNFFGINLSDDWYSLTNLSKLGYWVGDNDSANVTDFVIADYEVSHEQIDRAFFSLDFDELLLGFLRGMDSVDFNQFEPSFFLGRINYNNLEEYRRVSNTNTQALLTLIKSEYGDAELNMVKEEYSVYNWTSTLYQIVLTSREDELSTTVMYLK